MSIKEITRPFKRIKPIILNRSFIIIIPEQPRLKAKPIRRFK